MWDEPRTTMGNPYLGLEWPTRTPGLVWEIGFRLSQIEEYPGENMREVDPDRQEAFWTDTAQTQVMLDYSPPGHGRWDVRLRGGVVVDRYTGELTFLGNDGTFLRYGVRGKRSVGPAVLAFGVCGWVNTTLERGLMPAERTGEQCSFGLGTRLGWLETMLIFNVQPWKRQRENTRYVLMLLLSAGY